MMAACRRPELAERYSSTNWLGQQFLPYSAAVPTLRGCSIPGTPVSLHDCYNRDLARSREDVSLQSRKENAMLTIKLPFETTATLNVRASIILTIGNLMLALLS